MSIKLCDEKVDIIGDMLKNVETLKTNIIDYYSEDALTFNLDEFLKIFYELCNSVNRALEVSIFSLLFII